MQGRGLGYPLVAETRSSPSEPPLADLSRAWAALSAHRRIRTMVNDGLENQIARPPRLSVIQAVSVARRGCGDKASRKNPQDGIS